MNRCILQFNYYFVDQVVEERYRFLYFFLGFDNKISLSMFLRDTIFINSSKIDLTYLDIIDAAFLLFYVTHIILIVLILFRVSLGLV